MHDDEQVLDCSQLKQPVVMKTPEPPVDELDFPEGGLRAWLVVLGGAAATFSSFGYVNAWGVFQDYYSQTLLSSKSPSTIAWIGSIQYSLIFAFGVVWGRLFDLGIFHIPLLCASVLQVVATLLTAECKKYWQFLLCQGVAVGLASGCVFGPTLAVVAHWFSKKRSTAYGIIATGSSIGGTVFPIAVQNLIPRVGFQWTMRILAFSLVLTLGVLNLTMRRRLPPVRVGGGLFNFKAFKYIPFSLYTLSTFIAFLGLYTVLTYIAVSASEAGISTSFDVYLLSIANAASLFGRLSTGIMSDRIGCINTMVPFTLIAGAATYAWPFAHNLPSLIGIAVVYGFCSGVFVALIAVPLIRMGEVEDAGRRAGVLFTVLAIAALAGPPISGAIRDATGGFKVVGYYAGSAIVICVVLMWWARCLITGHFVRGKY